jgi:hypothetical protein
MPPTVFYIVNQPVARISLAIVLRVAIIVTDGIGLHHENLLAVGVHQGTALHLVAVTDAPSLCFFLMHLSQHRLLELKYCVPSVLSNR